MAAAFPTPADWSALRARVSGEVVIPGSPGYDRARKPAIARFHDARPQAVVSCATAGDVAEALAVARRFGLPAVPRSGGHCFAGRSSSPGMVIDVTPMRSVSVAGGNQPGYPGSKGSRRPPGPRSARQLSRAGADPGSG